MQFGGAYINACAQPIATLTVVNFKRLMVSRIPVRPSSPHVNRQDAVSDRPGAGRRHRHHREGAAGGEELLPGLPGGLHLGPDRGEGGAGKSGSDPDAGRQGPGQCSPTN